MRGTEGKKRQERERYERGTREREMRGERDRREREREMSGTHGRERERESEMITGVYSVLSVCGSVTVHPSKITVY